MPRMRTLIALDIETTGLDPYRDAIIEIGAVRFDPADAGDVPGTWHSLVNPCRPLPAFVADLTGIRQEELDGAPVIDDVLMSLAEFVGDYPIVGHNIGFDLGFLNRQGLFHANQPLDTVELASVLFPSAGRYTLSALVQELKLGVGEFRAHRGLADALASRCLYLALRERARRLPGAILAEIIVAGERIGWPQVPFFREALAGEPGYAGDEFSFAPMGIEELLHLPPLDPAAGPPRPPRERGLPAGTFVGLDADELAALLEPAGPVAREIPEYERRPQQLAVLRAVCGAFNEPNHLLVEAGTGTGKSVAYLVPAVTWAVENGQRVVVSTNTITLQDQLIQKDLPDLQRALPYPFRASVLKGRGNYLCPRRFEALRRSGPTAHDEMRLLAKLLVWLPGTTAGDKAELTLLGQGEQIAWMRLSAESELCTAERCVTDFGGRCPFWRAHAQAQSAHVVVVNHALLLADIMTGNRVLPEYKRLIVDEAHHLEEATTQGLSFHADRVRVERILGEVAGTRAAAPARGQAATAARPGLLSEIVRAVQGAVPEDIAGELRVHANRVAAGIAALERLLADFFETYGGFLNEQCEGQSSEYNLRLLLDHGMRLQPGWSQVETSWETASVQFGAILDGLEKLAEMVADLEYFEIPDWEDLTLRAAAARRELTELRGQMNQVAVQPSPSIIYWAETSGRARYPSMHAAPLHVGPLVEEHLFKPKDCVVLTSATLRAEDDFGFLRDRLHAWEADELAVDSPFDYQQSTLVYIVNDMPEPNQQGYQAHFERGLLALCKATQGRALVLFTSYGQLRATSQAIGGALAEAGIVVYEQSDGSSRRQLLDNFRESERAVLMGTRSFWEGVDVPGEALSVLVMPRLPFSVPSDPIFVARSRTFDDPFGDYAVPEAVLRFRQGFGRLIRRESDRGVVAVFDKRVITKAYGRKFLDALPACTVRRGALSQLPTAAQQWLDGA